MTLSKEAKQQAITIRLPSTEMELAKKAAEKDDRSLNSWIRQLVIKAVKTK